MPPHWIEGSWGKFYLLTKIGYWKSCSIVPPLFCTWLSSPINPFRANVQMSFYSQMHAICMCAKNAQTSTKLGSIALLISSDQV
jgi:hypothetical protein